jgi:hypothetical protein
MKVFSFFLALQFIAEMGFELEIAKIRKMQIIFLKMGFLFF